MLSWVTQRISEDEEGDADYSKENESCVSFSNNQVAISVLSVTSIFKCLHIFRTVCQIADEEDFTESSDDEYGDIANYDCSTDKKSEV